MTLKWKDRHQGILSSWSTEGPLMSGIQHRSLVLAALVLLAPGLRAADGSGTSTPPVPAAAPNQNKEIAALATLGPPVTLLRPKALANGLPDPIKGAVQPASFNSPADA